MDSQDIQGPGATREEPDRVVDVAAVELEQEVQRLRRQLADAETQTASRPHGVRRGFAAALVVLTVIAIAVSATGVWLRSFAFDTDRFMETVQPALESPEVADAISTRLTDETLTALDLENRLGVRLAEVGDALGGSLGEALDLTPAQQARIESLPLPQLEQLAGPIAAGLETRVADVVDRFVSSEEFQTLLVDLTRVAHTKAVALVRDDFDELPNVVVESGEVQIDLVPAVARVLANLVDEGLAAVGIEEIPFIDPAGDPEVALARLSQALDVELDPDFGKLTIMSESELEELQEGARLVDRTVWGFLIVTLGLIALTLVVSPDRRRGLLQLAVGAAVGVTLAMLLLRNFQDEIASVALTPDGERAVVRLADSTLDSLRTVMVVVLVAALVVAVIAHVAGRPPWVQRSRTWVGRVTASKPGGSDLEWFVADHIDLLRVATVGIGLVLLLVFGVTLLSTILVGVFLLVAIWGLNALRDRAHRKRPRSTHGADVRAGTGRQRQDLD